MNLRDLLQYVYAGLWEYILIVKVISDFWVSTECKATFACGDFS